MSADVPQSPAIPPISLMLNGHDSPRWCHPPKRGGRPARDRREIINAINYVVRTGCAWRLLPHDFPPWQTVYHYFRLWRIDGTWERMHDALREEVRAQAGRSRPPIWLLRSVNLRRRPNMAECPGPSLRLCPPWRRSVTAGLAGRNETAGSPTHPRR